MVERVVLREEVGRQDAGTSSLEGGGPVDEPNVAVAPERAFEAAAAALAGSTTSAARRRHAAVAGDALVALAGTGDASTLRGLLSPDPRISNVTWTVACYQVGDLTPSALADFADPVEAVATLAGCGQGHHVAAELVASTSLGLRWTALVRTNQRIGFQLPDADTAADASHAHAGELSEALRRWRARVEAWGRPAPAPAGDGAERWGPGAAAPVARADDGLDPLPSAPLPPAVDGRVADRLAALERATSTVATLAQQVASAVERIDERLADVDRRLAVATHRDERAGRTLDRIAEQMAVIEAAATSVPVAARAAVGASPAPVDARLSEVERRLGAGLVELARAVAAGLSDVEDRLGARLDAAALGAGPSPAAGGELQALRAALDDERAAREAVQADVHDVGAAVRSLVALIEPDALGDAAPSAEPTDR